SALCSFSSDGRATTALYTLSLHDALPICPDGASEAETYLTEARRKAEVPGLEDLTHAFLALCLDRLGRRDQARVVLAGVTNPWRSEEHTSELQSRENLVCRLLLEKKKKIH